MAITLTDLRRFAVSRSLFPPTTLGRAIDTLGFVQADPIRAPARAQDLILRHRVTNYRAGDLESRYPTLNIEEDVFINYGFVPRAVQDLMHPRGGIGSPAASARRVRALLAFVAERGAVHPREVDSHFSHGRVTNYWGGSSNATTHLLEAMHYRGLLRVARRDAGVRIYAVREPGVRPSGAAERRARIDALVDLAVRKYAPLPATSLSMVVSRLRYAVPQWRSELKAALKRGRARLAHQEVGGIEWFWPREEDPLDADVPATARLLAPFDPVVWDRRRFELLWGWAYRFEAYTPAARRKLGYYALPLLWRDQILGWANLSVEEQALHPTVGYITSSPPADRTFARELDVELQRVRRFLALDA